MRKNNHVTCAATGDLLGEGVNLPFATNAIAARFLENLDKKFDKRQGGLLYKGAEIYNAGGNPEKTWFVYYYYRQTITDKFKRFRITGDVNRFADPKFRQTCIEILKATVNEALKDGFNPFNQQKGPQYSTVANLTDAINEALKAKMLTANKKRTGDSYKAAARDFIKWLKEKKYDLIPITELKPKLVSEYQLHLIEAGKNSRTINKELSHLGNLYKKCMVNHEEITRNPFEVIENLIENDSRLYEAHTIEELKLWGNYLKDHDMNFFNFCLFVYYCGMRPESICALKIRDVMLSERKVIVDPVYHKNNRTGYKQILAPQMAYLQQLHLEKFPKDWFLFSNNFEPGEKKIRPVRASEYWKEKIIDGLGINKKLYALKHTFAQNYLEDNNGNENLDWLRFQFNHSSLAETDVYAKRMQMNFIDESTIKLQEL